MAATKAPVHPARDSVYVWELPVRIVHWVIVLAIIVLSFTGLYLHHPFLSGSGSAGHPGFTHGKLRFVHEGTGFVLIAAAAFRVYWAFVGNHYAHWRALIPTTAQRRHDLRAIAEYYALRRREPPLTNGHNPLAGLAYVGLYFGLLLSSLSGLGLYAWLLNRAPWTTLFGWTYRALALEQLRLLHFLLMFFFGAFTVHHLYSVILIDIEERNGETSSMFSGYKADVLEGSARDDPRAEEE